MSEPYAIARYLSDDDKQRILAHRFVRRGEETGDLDPDGLPVVYHGLVPVSVDDQYCPLAYVDGIEDQPSAPGASEIAGVLFRRVDPSESLDYEDYLSEIKAAAARFLDDWDHGQITDLHAALGVERRGS